MTTNQAIKESMDELLSVVKIQNETLKPISEMAFKVNILWRVFCVVCGSILASLLIWGGYIFIEAVRSGVGQ